MTISKIWNEATYFSYKRCNNQCIDCIMGQSKDKPVKVYAKFIVVVTKLSSKVLQNFVLIQLKRHLMFSKISKQ